MFRLCYVPDSIFQDFVTVRLLLLIVLAFPVSPAIGQEEPEDIDPWEPVNRKIFAFNETLDRYLLRPVAKGYHKVLPDPPRRAPVDSWSTRRSACSGCSMWPRGWE